MQRAFAIALMVLALIGAGTNPGIAQQSGSTQQNLEMGRVISPILIIDLDRLFFESAFGQRVAREDRDRKEDLAAEHRKVEAELAAEEQDLTEKRADMEPEEFRKLANAFDEKVQKTEAAQTSKARNLAELFRKEEDAFLRAAEPILKQLLRESGAIVIIERPQVVASILEVDITDRAIALLDETIGSGSTPD